MSAMFPLALQVALQIGRKKKDICMEHDIDSLIFKQKRVKLSGINSADNRTVASCKARLVLTSGLTY